MPDVRGRLRGLAVIFGVPALVAAGLLLPVSTLPANASPAAAEPRPVESIPAYDVVLTIDRKAVLHVRETITYDFDSGGEHGIARRVPYRRGDRLFGIRDVRASSSTGAPSRPRTLRLLNDVQITVGTRGHKVTGRQAYVIEYEVYGAFTRRDRPTGKDRIGQGSAQQGGAQQGGAHQNSAEKGWAELRWDAVGSAWDVPIGEAAVRVQAPVPLHKASCRAGTREAATRCLRERDGPYAIGFTQRGLRPREGMFVRVRLPEGVVAVPPPEYARPRWAGTWWGTAAIGVALGAAVLVVVPVRRGRPLPGRRAGEALAAAGALIVLADVADDTVPRGPWAFSLGDLAVAGLAVMVVGAGIGYARRARRGEGAATAPGEDYS
ncbi:DUF2207 domain-containing protein [Actinomadura sp. 9N407]|uniref:DUF2207 domain-containing protein n=1 Tax=Actinomadura sp. 9N407 TaxID=3375154 RepID=UPI003798CBF7